MWVQGWNYQLSVERIVRKIFLFNSVLNAVEKKTDFCKAVAPPLKKTFQILKFNSIRGYENINLL